MEENKMTLKELLGMLSEKTTIGDLMEAGYEKEEAEFIHAIYNEGMNFYKWKYYCMKDKYTKLCVATCEKLLMGEK